MRVVVEFVDSAVSASLALQLRYISSASLFLRTLNLD